MKLSIRNTFAALLFVTASHTASAAGIIPPGGMTTVDLSGSIGVLAPLNPVTLGTATLTGTNPDINFPITGGLMLASSSIIRHDGSGLGLSNGLAGSMLDAIELTDFVINTGTGILTGSVAATIDGAMVDLGAGISLLEIVTGTVVLTTEAADALAFVFNNPALGGLAGTSLGNVSVNPVPLPAAFPLLGMAIGALGFARRRNA